MPLRQSVRLGLIVGALFLLSACATTRVATAPARPAPTPPSKSAAPIAPGYEETGDASWYGHPYHGRKAASGETYDMNQMTAAHRTLPFGTRVRVESLVDGSSVEVRINDRGPFKEEDKRILDLSYAAAKLLGAVGPGVIPVKIRVVSIPGYTNATARLSPATTTPPPAPPIPLPQPSPPLAPPSVAMPVAPPPVGPAPVTSAPAVSAVTSVPPAPAVSAATVAAPTASGVTPVAALPGQTPISPPAQAPPPIVAETATSRTETAAASRVEVAARAQSPVTPPPPAPSMPAPSAAPAPAPSMPAPSAAPAPAPSMPAPSATALAIPSAPASPAPVPSATPTPIPPTRGALAEGWSVQLGAYASQGSAISLRDSLARSWPDARVTPAEVSGRTLWRVRVGNYTSRRDADEAAKRLTASGYRAMVVESGRP